MAGVLKLKNDDDQWVSWRIMLVAVLMRVDISCREIKCNGGGVDSM